MRLRELSAVLDCLNKGVDFSEINSTLIVLIPKKSAFVSGRIIYDNIILANELVHNITYRKVGKRGWSALKLDMAKAFDRVEWDFLRKVMFHLNFPVNFVSLIFKCLSSATISFSVNGVVSEPIKPTRGLRQGDPLSPYLFILCSEGLSAILSNYQRRGLLRGLAIARNAPSISYLLFADDSILFCSADSTSCAALNQALTLYSKASGQMIILIESPTLFIPGITNGFRGQERKHLLKLFFKPFLPMPCPVLDCQLNFVRKLSPLFQNSGGVPRGIIRKFIGKIGELFVNQILEAGPGFNPSYSWRSLLWGRDLMKRGLIWKVGDGSNIHTIQDHWIPGLRYKFYASPPPPDSTLSYFLSPSGGWNLDRLN
ncbi:uncharacterized protein LOC115695408 [Cannabis sativa]|uniref:uncharacterized protein LOC115695408 n=1 Tax=Cannabis sativa TaxID=3483 RepID=UPI0029CA4B5C|nr:uncharacterized protein LOC115695408 [Cannabis sativa]